MVSVNCKLESPRVGALLEGVTKDRRIRKCASVVVELENEFSHPKGTETVPIAHHGCFEMDDSSNKLILLIRNTQLSRSGPSAGVYMTSRLWLAARTREMKGPTCFLLTARRCGTRLPGTPHSDR